MLISRPNIKWLRKYQLNLILVTTLLKERDQPKAQQLHRMILLVKKRKEKYFSRIKTYRRSCRVMKYQMRQDNFEVELIFPMTWLLHHSQDKVFKNEENRKEKPVTLHQQTNRQIKIVKLNHSKNKKQLQKKNPRGKKKRRKSNHLQMQNEKNHLHPKKQKKYHTLWWKKTNL